MRFMLKAWTLAFKLELPLCDFGLLTLSEPCLPRLENGSDYHLTGLYFLNELVKPSARHR